MHLSLDASSEEILAFVERGIDILSGGDYELAYASVEHDPYYQWTPSVIRSVITGMGFPSRAIA